MRVTRGSSAGSERFASAASPEALGAGRAVAGAAMIAAPTLVTSALGADPASARQTAWVVQMLGAREIAVGAGSLLGLRGDRRSGSVWLAAGLVCDVVDAVALTAAVRGKRVPALPGTAVVAVAAGAVAIQVAALRRRR